MYSVNLTARNPLGAAHIAPLTVSLLDLPANLSLSTPRTVYAPGDTVTVSVNTQTLGTAPCYDVDYGDGSKRHLYGRSGTCTELALEGDFQGDWLAAMTLTRTYAKSQLYQVTVCAQNVVTDVPRCKR